MQELPVKSRAPLQAAEAPCELLALTRQASENASAVETHNLEA